MMVIELLAVMAAAATGGTLGGGVVAWALSRRKRTYRLTVTNRSFTNIVDGLFTMGESVETPQGTILVREDRRAL